MPTTEDVHIDALGLCEHCNALVSMLNLPADSIDAIWRCSCGQEMSHLSFGFDKGGLGAKKVKWVGPGRVWVDQQPTQDFELGHIHVMVPMM